jgi:8-oxo-dGTP diphosphatase
VSKGEIEVVCGVIENTQGEFLACLRPAGKHLGGCWEFPGGKVDFGETPESALVRELAEELGVLVEVERALSPVIWDYGDRVIRLLPFRCRLVQGEPRAIEHEALLWVSAVNYDSLSWAEADQPILAEIFL